MKFFVLSLFIVLGMVVALSLHPSSFVSNNMRISQGSCDSCQNLPGLLRAGDRRDL